MIKAFLFVLSITHAGHFTGNGGDSYAADFRYWEAALLQQLSQTQETLPFSIDHLQVIASKTIIQSEKELRLRGRLVDAINIPDPLAPKIFINRQSWDLLNISQKLRLIYHEYLGLMEIDDSRFQISGKLIFGEICSRHPSIVSAVEMYLKRSCRFINPDDLRFIEELTIPNIDSNIQPTDLAGLTQVRKLTLSGNQLRVIPAGLLQDLTLMTHFILEADYLKSIDHLDWSKNKALQQIDLAKTNLRSLNITINAPNLVSVTVPITTRVQRIDGFFFHCQRWINNPELQICAATN